MILSKNQYKLDVYNYYGLENARNTDFLVKMAYFLLVLAKYL
jgi:hypothetical protein